MSDRAAQVSSEPDGDCIVLKPLLTKAELSWCHSCPSCGNRSWNQPPMFRISCTVYPEPGDISVTQPAQMCETAWEQVACTTEWVQVAVLRPLPTLAQSATVTVAISGACQAHLPSVSDVHLGHLVDRLLSLADTVSASPSMDRIVFRCRTSDGKTARVTGSKSLLCAVSDYFAASEWDSNAQAFSND